MDPSGAGYNPTARACFLRAFEEGRPAELISSTEWVPGQVITEYDRSLGNGTGEIWFNPWGDPTQSRWVLMAGCNFYSSDQVLDGPAPPPIFAQGCVGPVDY